MIRLNRVWKLSTVKNILRQHFSKLWVMQNIFPRSWLFGKTTIVALSSMLLLSPPAFGENRTPVAVAVTQVQYSDHAREIRTSGILAYKSRQVMSFKTAGPIDKLLVDEGDNVKKGQLLTSLTLDEIKAQVDEASARVKMARSNLARFAKLHDSKALSLDRLQSAETDLAVWESKLRIARFNLEYSSIKAPEAGTILRRHVEDNELVSPYQPILTIADTSRGWVIRTGITDEEVVRVRKGDSALVSFDAWPGEHFTGTITRLAALADEQTGTFEVEISLPSSFAQLRAGFIGKVTITPAITRNVALIPVEAVVQSNQNNADVFVVNQEAGTVQKRQIQLSYITPGQIAIDSGVEPGELVVTTGAGFLREGEQARVLSGLTATETVGVTP